MSQTESKRIASRYVKALFDLAQSEKQLDEVQANLVAFRTVLAASPELQRFLTNPALNRAQLTGGIDAVLVTMKSGELTRRFFRLLAENRRLSLISAIIEGFLFELAKSRGEMEVEVTSAAPLAKQQADAIAAALGKALNKKITLTLRENPDLIGGLRIRMGSRMIDHSVLGRLERLRASLQSQAA